MKTVVFTGGPGTGKSTTLQALQQCGQMVMPESGRAILQMQQALSLSHDVQHFSHDMFTLDYFQYQQAQKTAHDSVFFDRGLVDIIGYLQLMNTSIPTHFHLAAKTLRYDIAFIFPFWESIYCQDNERVQNIEKARQTEAAMRYAYSQYGYTLIDVPKMSVLERVDFVLSCLDS